MKLQAAVTLNLFHINEMLKSVQYDHNKMQLYTNRQTEQAL